MSTILVTGASGFIGRHVLMALARRDGMDAIGIEREDPPQALERALAEADAIIHLAGANRPPVEADFERINVGLTEAMCARLVQLGRSIPVVFSSSIQAELDNPYGRSKRAAEEVLREYASRAGAAVSIFRLQNVFGKWCRPNYNSAVATFCHAVARGLPYQVSDPARVMQLLYVDDVVEHLVQAAAEPPAPGAVEYREVRPVYRIALGELAGRIESFRRQRTSLLLADHSDRFNVSLYATYLSYLDPGDLAYPLEIRSDARGSLAEFLKSPHLGQIFVSRTLPGITRGNHFHHTKTEKFLVLEGQAVIRFRRIDGAEVIEYPVDGREYRVVDIPPGYTHSIENVGTGELVVLFWASEVFDPERPDTYFEEVLGVQA